MVQKDLSRIIKNNEHLQGIIRYNMNIYKYFKKDMKYRFSNEEMNEYYNFKKNCIIEVKSINLLGLNIWETLNYKKKRKFKREIPLTVKNMLFNERLNMSILTEINYVAKLDRKTVKTTIYFNVTDIRNVKNNCGLAILENLESYNYFIENFRLNNEQIKSFNQLFFDTIYSLTSRNMLFLTHTTKRQFRYILKDLTDRDIAFYETPFYNVNSENKQFHYCINIK